MSKREGLSIEVNQGARGGRMGGGLVAAMVILKAAVYDSAHQENGPVRPDGTGTVRYEVGVM